MTNVVWTKDLQGRWLRSLQDRFFMRDISGGVARASLDPRLLWLRWRCHRAVLARHQTGAFHHNHRLLGSHDPAVRGYVFI
ncbi:MAG: hypothetical protein WCD79_09125 [Chthoniobacteraceae bacterium]